MSNNRIFAVGQRWLSDTEPDLGLGTVSETQGRTVTLQFNASEEQRQYAQASAPLTRLILKPGHHIDLSEMLERDDAKQAEIVDVSLNPQHTLLYQVRVGDETHPLPEVLLPDDGDGEKAANTVAVAIKKLRLHVGRHLQGAHARQRVQDPLLQNFEKLKQTRH